MIIELKNNKNKHNRYFFSFSNSITCSAESSISNPSKAFCIAVTRFRTGRMS